LLLLSPWFLTTGFIILYNIVQIFLLVKTNLFQCEMIDCRLILYINNVFSTYSTYVCEYLYRILISLIIPEVRSFYSHIPTFR
jgi:hypothetical protein